MRTVVIAVRRVGLRGPNIHGRHISLARELTMMGFHVIIVSGLEPNLIECEIARKLNIELIYLPILENRNVFKQIRILWSSLKTVVRLQPNLIIAHYNKLAAFMSIVSFIVPKCQLIVWQRTDYNSTFSKTKHHYKYDELRKALGRIFMKGYLSYASAICANSEFVANQILVRFGKNIRRKVRIIKNCIPENHFDFGSDNLIETKVRQFCQTEDFLPSDRILLVIGTLHDHKGQLYAIEALPSIIAKIVCHLVFVGKGPEICHLRQRAGELGIGGFVHFWGWGSHPEIKTWLELSELIVVPSLAEAAGFVILESMLMGKPVIASNVGGIPEYINDGETGLLFEAGNHKDLAEKALRILAEPSMGRQLAKRAFEINFSGNYTRRMHSEMGLLSSFLY